MRRPLVDHCYYVSVAQTKLTPRLLQATNHYDATFQRLYSIMAAIIVSAKR